MNRNMYIRNGKRNGSYIQQVPSLYQNSAHNHQYYSYSKGNSAISMDELTELNLNSPINVIGRDTVILNPETDSYRNSHYFSKAAYGQQFPVYSNTNLSYTGDFHSLDAVPMTENCKGFQSMSMPITTNDYQCSQNYSVDSFKSFFGSNSPGYPIYKKIKDPYIVFSEEPLTSVNIFDDQQLLEKHRKRRESHNAVERRRRDNINEKIQELAALVSKNPFKDKIESNMDMKNVSNGDLKPNKGEILRKSADYIRCLQNYISELNTRSQWLESEVIRLGGDISLMSKLEPMLLTPLNTQETSTSNCHDDNSDDLEIKKEHHDELDMNY